MTSDSPSDGSSTPTRVDPFFILAACRTLFSKRLTEIARESGISDAAVLAAMAREASEAHDELASGTPAEGFEQTHGLTASRISLVGNDDLEIDIRISDIAGHLRDDKRIDPWRVQLRYMSLLQRPQMTSDQNPLGMEPIRRALWAVCRETGGSLDQRLARLDRLEETLKLRLPDVYFEINQLLESRGIHPAHTPRPGHLASRHRPPAATHSTSSFALLQSTMQQGNQSVRAAGDGMGAFLDASAGVMLNHLIERMDAIEHGRAATPGGSVLKHQPIKSKDIKLAPGQPAAIAMDTLALIFEAVFASPDLPDIVKSLLARLQIPLVKLSLCNTAFFADDRHPARRLLSRVADASFGLPPRVAADHPVCIHLARIVDAAKTALNGDDDLTPHLARLDALIARRDEAIRTAARPLIELVHSHEHREIARAVAEDWLEKTLPKVSVPTLANFLSTHWVRAMAQAFESGGSDGQEWKEAASTIETLLWSLRPKQTPEERHQLIATIPTLLRQINTWIDRVGVPDKERKPFLDTCFALQTAALRGRAIERAEISPAVPRCTAGAATPSSPLRILEAAGRKVLYHADPTVPARPGSSPITIGDWLRCTLPDGRPLNGTCCWQSSQTSTVLIFSPVDRHALAVPHHAIDTQLRSGQARKLSGAALFDEAARRALQQIRGG